MDAGDILVEIFQLLVLVRNGHTLQVCIVPHGLKVPTDEKKIDFVLILCFKTRDGRINGVEIPMTATFNCDL